MITCNTSSTDLIDIAGLCKGEDIEFVQPNTTVNPPVVGTNNWIQLNVSEILVVPPQKPDIEDINSISTNVTIMRQQVIVTPSSGTLENLEGKILTGRKLIVEGELCLKVVYTACDIEQTVHSTHFYVPFSSYIVVPANVVFPNGDIRDSLYVNFLVNACIEDAFVRRVTDRKIYHNVTILLQAIPSINCE